MISNFYFGQLLLYPVPKSFAFSKSRNCIVWSPDNFLLTYVSFPNVLQEISTLTQGIKDLQHFLMMQILHWTPQTLAFRTMRQIQKYCKNHPRESIRRPEFKGTSWSLMYNYQTILKVNYSHCFLSPNLQSLWSEKYTQGLIPFVHLTPVLLYKIL